MSFQISETANRCTIERLGDGGCGGGGGGSGSDGGPRFATIQRQEALRT